MKTVFLALKPIIDTKYPIENNKSVDRSRLKVCVASLALMPASDTNYLPYYNYGEGNCLYKSASMVITGSERSHCEFRVRTCMELCVFDYLYLNADFLRETKQGYLKKVNLVQIYASFAKLNKQMYESHQAFYEKEVRNNMFADQDAGCWQVHALPEVMKSTTKVIYPVYAGHTVRKYLNGIFIPRSFMGVSNCFNKKCWYIPCNSMYHQ